MERPQYISYFEVEDSQNPPVEAVVTEGSTIDMSVRDRDNLEWKLGKEQRTIEGPNQLHGVYRNGVYYHYGVPQRKRG